MLTNSEGAVPKKLDALGPVQFDALDVHSALEMLLSAPRDKFRYVVTPNVDHVVRIHTDPAVIPYYRAAWLSLNDSRVLQLMLSLLGTHVPVARGSDLTSLLLNAIAATNARVAVVGSSPSVIEELCKKHPRLTILHMNPPMGFYNDPARVAECVDFVRHAEADFIFFAVGSPQQELVAFKCLEDGRCQGIGLCIGASLLMHVGREERAPVFLRTAGLEWLYRLAQNPRRLWHRYFVRDPIIFLLVAREAWRRLWTKTSRAR